MVEVAQTVTLRDGRLLSLATDGRLFMGEVRLLRDDARQPTVFWHELKGRVLEVLPRG